MKDEQLRFPVALEVALMDESRSTEQHADNDLVRTSSAYHYVRGRAQGLSDAASQVRVMADEMSRTKNSVVADKCFSMATNPALDISVRDVLIQAGNALDLAARAND